MHPPYLIRALQILGHRHIRLVALEPETVEMDFNTPQTRAWLDGMVAATELLTDGRREACRAALRRRKDAGLAFCGRPQLGKKRIRGRNGVLYDVLWPPEWELIREIKARHDRGEGFTSIAKDFYARKLIIRENPRLCRGTGRV